MSGAASATMTRNVRIPRPHDVVRWRKKTPPALAAQPALAEGADGFGGGDQRDDQREPRAERHAVSTWATGSARTRSRGSAMPRRMSASRFPATTTTLAVKAVAVTSG